MLWLCSYAVRCDVVFGLPRNQNSGTVTAESIHWLWSDGTPEHKGLKQGTLWYLMDNCAGWTWCSPCEAETSRIWNPVPTCPNCSVPRVTDSKLLFFLGSQFMDTFNASKEVKRFTMIQRPTTPTTLNSSFPIWIQPSTMPFCNAVGCCAIGCFILEHAEPTAEPSNFLISSRVPSATWGPQLESRWGKPCVVKTEPQAPSVAEMELLHKGAKTKIQNEDPKRYLK